MAINLQVNLGTINFTDWLHVTAAKVSDPNTVVWESWIDVPVTNYVFVIPGLDPDVYYVTFYDAPTNVALGTLVSQAFVSALSAEWEYEVRFYEIGNLPAGASIDATEKILNDPYLIGKTIQSTFKEGFRFLEPDIDTAFDDTAGDIQLLIPTNFETGEKFVVTLKYAVGNSSGSGGGLYSGTITVTEATKTLSSLDKNKRVRLLGALATQVITVPALAALTNEDGYYFDNSCGGVAMQVKILLPGTDRIKFNGFMAASDLFAEFWVSKGEHLLIRKFNSTQWEVITDYKGVHVGERLAAGFKGMPGTIPEDGSEVDGDEYGRLWWWINNVLPATHYISDDSGTQIANRRAQFLIKPATKKILMPNMQSLSERGLADFNTYGGDTANRAYDYPGGIQDEMVGPHTHTVNTDDQQYKSDNSENRDVMIPGSSLKTTSVNAGTENRVVNSGVIYARRI